MQKSGSRGGNDKRQTCAVTLMAYARFMSTVQEIELAVRRLTPEELAKFREWFEEFDAEAWDKQFARDAAAGRLDALGQEALRDLREGRCKEL